MMVFIIYYVTLPAYGKEKKEWKYYKQEIHSNVLFQKTLRSKKDFMSSSYIAGKENRLSAQRELEHCLLLF
jgi:hypothetical protein